MSEEKNELINDEVNEPAVADTEAAAKENADTQPEKSEKTKKDTKKEHPKMLYIPRVPSISAFSPAALAGRRPAAAYCLPLAKSGA